MDLQTSFREVIRTYHELNPARIEELHDEPSPLEFFRYVAKNRPLVIRGAAKTRKAYIRWNSEYLKTKLGQSRIQVAVTPDGRADAPRRYPDGGPWYFAKPLETEMGFSDFMDYFKRPSSVDGQRIWYAQTQNDNLRGEYAEIFDDVDQEIRWASIALEQGPDAINMWIGSSQSSTAMHKDPYQNIFCQLIGQKHFVLVSPIETACLNEQLLPPATWIKAGSNLKLQPDKDGSPVPCAMWDPNHPSMNRSGLSDECRPLRVTLEAGDMMYLPAMWYHQVSQTEGDEGFCCSINYWYDMEYSGTFFSHDQLVRILSRAAVVTPA